MNKFIVVFVVLAFVIGCKEARPPINCEAEPVVLKDTVYLLDAGSVPMGNPRGILVEDLTGTGCVACPGAAVAAADIQSSISTNEIVVLGLYPTFRSILTLPKDGYEDMRTEAAQLIGQNIFNFSNVLPNGGVNRKKFDGETEISIPFSTWKSKAESFTTETGKANIELSVSQENDSTYVFGYTTTLTEALDNDPFISIFLLENNIVHPQKYPDSTSAKYKHKHVLRKAYTAYNGTPLLNDEFDTPQKGLVFEKQIELVIPEGVVHENASIAVIVNYNDGDNKEAIQCTEVKLK